MIPCNVTTHRALPIVSAAALLMLLFAHQPARAQDRNFARTYQSNVKPSGGLDVELWNTLRMGKEGEGSPYDFGRILDQRLEFEVGLGGDVQTSLYFNLSQSTLHTIGASDFTTSTEIGVSNEWKWKLTDPVADGIGTALYGEASFTSSEIELEGKVILDKRFGSSIIAANVAGEVEFETELDGDEVEQETEVPVELNLGYMYMCTPTFGIGVEARNANEISDGEWEKSVWFAGPTAFVSTGNFFFILNVQPQLFMMKREEGTVGNLDLVDHEKVEARLLMGITL